LDDLTYNLCTQIMDEILSSVSDNEDALEALCQAAEAAERYEDMVKIIEALVHKKLSNDQPLTADQRNLLSVAYKNLVGAKRSSWRMLNEENQFENADLVASYKKQIEKELKDKCDVVLEVLNKLVDQNEKRMDGATDVDIKECQVFYLKMLGDYYRYLTEVFSSNEDYKEKCKTYYEKAMAIATDALEATHPTRLGLALNFSVCHFEILNEPKDACDLAKKAFDEAIEKLDSLSDVSYRDSTLIMQLLRDNLTIWTQNNDETAD